ncbi:hypothetical protein IFT73_16390 [Aeromicrobium sp. CFBP 8757]|uniref:hypothetical protein n=1 Tax=Aeromicrobium sp. CFBP 8757 TaxID=2775288 RepID=UPI001781AAA3|nr:hypothetical protein [Aeromicrobium sp. CFBP 8757]MBD8608436.1 hypothetical protein [Aeromicrobium sp. CFBP 8757]
MTDTRTSRSGTAVAWVLYVLQVLGSALLALFAITSVFMTDSCGSVSAADEPAVCNTSYFGTVLFGYWIALAVLLVLVPIVIVRSSRRGQAAWVRALGGLVLAGALTVLFVVLMVR